MCGTAEFLAPEIINFEDISFLTDMWAVGVICYILMSGYSPVLGDTDGDTYNNIARSGNLPNIYTISNTAGSGQLEPPKTCAQSGGDFKLADTAVLEP